MKRDTARELAVQAVFSAPFSGENIEEYLDRFFEGEHFATLTEEGCGEIYDETPKGKTLRYIYSTVSGVFEHLEEIDSLIEKNSKGWSVKRISGTARAVMRVAVYELLFAEDVPAGAAINSAVEIDKGYDDADVVAFVNGVLGSVASGLSEGDRTSG